MVKKILIGIIDDHVQTAVSISQVLENNGFETFQAYNSKEAVDKIKSQEPDLVITDIRLEGEVTGIDIAKMFPKQKFLLITGFDFGKDELKNVNNFIGILRKPVDIDQLLDIIRKEFKIKKLKVI